MTWPNLLPQISPLFVKRFSPLSCALGLAVMAAVVCDLVYLGPAQERMDQAAEAYRAARSAITAIETARAAQQAARMTKSRIEAFEASLPAQQEFATLAMRISDWGRAEHLSIPSMTYTLGRSAGKKPVKGTISFVVTGEYQAIYRFIHKLETTESYLVIEELRAARSGKDSNSRVAFSMKIATFLRPEPVQEASL